ncbi:M42 family peptidase [bacterium]|nr:M42 family peptidase [bacterium]
MKFALELSDGFGPSSGEKNIAELIKKELSSISIDLKRDELGSLIVFKEGKNIKNHGIILSAHMDEVGFIISKINDDGTLSFRKLGGIDNRLLPAKRVIIGENRIKGTIMSPPIHLSKKSEMAIDTEQLTIFIGAKDKKQALEKVEIGDLATFDQIAFEKQDTLWGKAFDDRIGCYILTQILKMDWDINITGIFSVQEEVGVRGIQSALEYASGEFGFAIEGTTAYDIERDFPEESPSTFIGKGPAITVVDRMSIGTNSLKKIVEGVAKGNNIPYQFKKTVSGGTETFYLLNQKNIPAICISVPVRYIHAPLGFCKKEDIINTIKLVKGTAKLLEFQMKKLYGGK